MTGVKKAGVRDSNTFANMGALTLEDMNLDRKTEFQFDAFDPFKIGNMSSTSDLKDNLQLSA